MRSIVWLRRDIRLRDNVALARACEKSDEVVLAYVLDPLLLASGRMSAAIVQCFFSALSGLQTELRERGGDLALLCGDPAEVLLRFARTIDARHVHFNDDYEPFARERDEKVRHALVDAGVEVGSYGDHVYFGADEIVRDDGSPYRVFTAYRTRWLAEFGAAPRSIVPSLRLLEGRLAPRETIGETLPVPVPEDYGFSSSDRYPVCSERASRDAFDAFVRNDLTRYAALRDVPAEDATSHLSPQLRAGTIGIRTCMDAAVTSPAWMNELIWRDFYAMVLARYPHVATAPFLKAGERIAWRNSSEEFDAWCSGMTGYPIVDAAMRRLVQTGWMHNRLRMIVASFLTKDLLIDWRLGERYFERHLADADIAQNNGGWQWCASTGTDAAPYFRIFNPVAQGRRYDPQGTFVRSALPELKDVPPEFVHAPWLAPNPPRGYPSPIVDHGAARQRALEAFGRAFARTPAALR